MMTAYEHCEHCGRPIPEGDAYCGFCHGIAGTNISDLDMIHDPETDPLPHHEFPKTGADGVKLSASGLKSVL